MINKEHTKITLGIVDQSPVRRGGTAAEALRETVELAQVAEKAGYTRYWVAEHHNSGGFAGTSPEILIGQIAAKTSRIHVGSGGVMLSHYSALKVAEQFSILNSFYPGRIDLGIGRAPGSDQLTAMALADPRPQMDIRAFPSVVNDLMGFLHGTLEANHPFAAIHLQPGPQPEHKPEVWLLGSSDYSARLAAMLGLPFSFAEFFANTPAEGMEVAEIYRQEFKPSQYLKEPRLNVAVQAVCAPTAEEAKFVASSRFLMGADRSLKLGLGPGLRPPEEASQYPLTEAQKSFIASQGTRRIEGDPQTVKEGILEAAADFKTNDVSVVTNVYHFKDRARSYQLIAEAFALGQTAEKNKAYRYPG